MGTTSVGAGQRHRRLRRVIAATAVVVGLAVPLATQAPAAARSTSDTAEPTQQATAKKHRLGPLERRVRQREQALVAVQRAAARYAEVKEAKADRFARLGYTGDIDAATHVLPLAGYHLSAGFGASGDLWESDHTGQDFAAPIGTSLVAVGDGVVTSVADSGPYGLRTIITLTDGTDVWYCHQLLSLVSPGDSVEIAQEIGLLGSTGNSTGPHVHLEVRPGGGGPIDPLSWLAGYGLRA
jgi:murein DD-endopeptidase MepM/ murein hydrolase activator NlpD